MTAVAVTIRIATVADESTIADVVTEHCDDMFAEFPQPLRESLADLQRRARLDGLAAQHPLAEIWIIDRGADAAGYALVDLSGAGDIRLVDLVVRPSERRRGAASALTAHLTHAADAVSRSLALSVEPSSPAEALYARHGFRPLAEADTTSGHREMRRDAASIVLSRGDHA